jgi:hypothetical protein
VFVLQRNVEVVETVSSRKLGWKEDLILIVGGTPVVWTEDSVEVVYSNPEDHDESTGDSAHGAILTQTSEKCCPPM